MALVLCFSFIFVIEAFLSFLQKVYKFEIPLIKGKFIKNGS